MNLRTEHVERVSLTNTSTNENGNLDVEDILSRSTVRSINTNSRQVTASVVDLNEVTTSTVDAVILLVTLQGRLGHGGDNLGARANTLSQCIGPITDLTDVDRDVGVLGGRGDSELKQLSV